VKYRIDGSLGEAMAPIAKEHHDGISRTKSSELRFRAAHSQTGSGRAIQGTFDRARVSIMPSINGEDAVIRILDKESISENSGR
jgi:type IV pilus assembly protein PilB